MYERLACVFCEVFLVTWVSAPASSHVWQIG